MDFAAAGFVVDVLVVFFTVVVAGFVAFALVDLAEAFELAALAGDFVVVDFFVAVLVAVAVAYGRAIESNARV